MSKRLLVATVLMLLALAVLTSAQITVPYTFTAGTIIDPDQMNTNFSTLGNSALNRTGGGLTGPLTTQALTPSATNTYDIGTTSLRYRNAWLSGTFTVAGATTLNGATYTWPGTVGTSNTVLTSNGAGALSWSTPSALAAVPMDVATTTYSAIAGYFVVALNSGYTVTLPPVAGTTGKTVDVKNAGSGTITVKGNGTELIDGVNTFVLAVPLQSVTVISDGTQWFVR